MTIIRIYWPIFAFVLVVILIPAVGIIIDRRQDKRVDDKLEAKQDIKVCHEAHKGIESLVREMSTMLGGSIESSDRYKSDIQQMFQTHSKDMTKRMDKHVIFINEKVAFHAKRIETFKDHVDDIITTFSGKLDDFGEDMKVHLIENGRKNVPKQTTKDT